jgi:glycosyltransferase involved in cell wall biosynthesis
MNPGDATRPLVVAMVPAWNAEAFILETLESLKRQTYENLQIHISVDLSTDDTAAICEAFAATDARFRVLHQTRRLGWAENSNTLLRLAEGKYCFFAFHDDWLEPGYVSELVNVLESEPGAVLAFSDLELTHLDGAKETCAFSHIHRLEDAPSRLRTMLSWESLWWVPNRGLFRTDVGKGIGGIQKFLAGEFSADFPWLTHLALHGAFLRVPRMLCHKRYMKASLSCTWRQRDVPRIATILSAAREVLRADVSKDEKAEVLPLVVRFALQTLHHLVLEGERDPVHYERELSILRQPELRDTLKACLDMVGLDQRLVDFQLTNPWSDLIAYKWIPAKTIRRSLRHARRMKALARQKQRLAGALAILDTEAVSRDVRENLKRVNLAAPLWNASVRAAFPSGF